MPEFQRPRLKTPNIAARVFGFNNPGQVVTAVPRTKFMYFVKFALSSEGAAMTGNANLNTYEGNRGISFKVRQVDKPKVALTTSELNQYNKKRLAYTKIDYSEATLRIYDTVDDSVLALWIDYFTFYFGDSRRKNDAAYRQSPVDPEFVDSSGWGFRPISESVNFFDKITIYAFYANTYTAFSYINPKITSVDWQQKAYDSSDPEEINLSIKYEAIEYEEFGKPYDYREFGWLPTDSIATNEVIPNKPASPTPRIFGQSTSPQPFDFNLQQQFINPRSSTSTIVGGITEIASLSPSALLPNIRLPYESTLLGTPTFGTNSTTASITQASSTSVRPSGEIAAQIGAARERNAQLRDAAERAGLIQPGSTGPITGRLVGGVVTGVTVNGRFTDLTGTLTPDEKIRVDRARELSRMMSSPRTGSGTGSVTDSELF